MGSKITVPLVSSVLSAIIGVTGTYVAIKVDDAQQNVRLERIESNIETAKEDFRAIVLDHGKLKMEMLEVKSKSDRAAEAFERMEKAINSMSSSLSDVAIALGRMDERLKTIERRQSR